MERLAKLHRVGVSTWSSHTFFSIEADDDDPDIGVQKTVDALLQYL